MDIDLQNFGAVVDENALSSHDSTIFDNKMNLDNSFSSEVTTNEEDNDAHGGSAHHVTRWKRSRKNFSDSYLEFFNSTSLNSIEHSVKQDSQKLHESQIGSIVWTSDEKKAFFIALARFGRHDLSRVAAAIGSKSPIEITAYLDAIRTAEVNRQMFMSNPKNASIADMPAAVEIGPECEKALEIAADALNAYQEQYDITVGQKEEGVSWLIDRDTASQLDKEAAKLDVDPNQPLFADDSDNQAPRRIVDQLHAHGHLLFDISQMLDLSEEFFMNHPDDSVYPHWSAIAEIEQRPSITKDSIQLMAHLILDRIRQVLKLAIQVADARLSNMSAGGYNPLTKLSHSDMITALEMLKMPHDAWDFWTELARRNKFRVVTGSHSKGQSRSQIISYENTETALAPRRGRGKRRSMSITSEASSRSSGAEDSAQSSELGIDHSVDNGDEQSGQTDNHISNDEDEEYVSSASHTSESLRLPEIEGSEISDVDSEMDGKDQGTSPSEALEQYLEKLDQTARVNEEKTLWQVLGKRLSTDVEEEEEEEEQKQKSMSRPKRSRKTVEELRGWSCTYMAEWERFGRAIIPEDKDTVLSEDDSRTEFTESHGSG